MTLPVGQYNSVRYNVATQVTDVDY